MYRTDKADLENAGEPGARQTQDKSLGELIADLSRDTFRLVRQELAYAKLEMAEKVSMASRDTTHIIIGAAMVYAGFLALLAALVIGVAAYIPIHLAALLVGLVTSGVGWMVVSAGRRSLRRKGLAPRETIEALKGDSQWIKKQVM